MLVLGKQNPSKYWTEYTPSVHYSLGLIPTSAERRKEKGGMKTKELRDGVGWGKKPIEKLFILKDSSDTDSRKATLIPGKDLSG